MDTKQYNHLAKDYSKLILQDPIKNYAQYPGALKLLGNVKGKLVLDIGCGDGHFSSMIAKKGAEVVGYDISQKQIELAKETEKKVNLGMEFFYSTPQDFFSPIKFDKAISNMVLFYAKDENELLSFFKSAFKHLKNKGEFIAILVNAEYKRLGEIHYNRRITRIKGKKMKSDFFINNEYAFSSEYNFFSKKDYESAAAKAGFKSLKWAKLEISPEGIKKMGKKFWEGYYEDCLYATLIATK